jgi:hypothetical protein
MKYEVLNYSHLGSNLFLVLYMIVVAKNLFIIKNEDCNRGYVCDIENKTVGLILCIYMIISRLASLRYFQKKLTHSYEINTIKQKEKNGLIVKTIVWVIGVIGFIVSVMILNFW